MSTRDKVREVTKAHAIHVLPSMWHFLADGIADKAAGAVPEEVRAGRADAWTTRRQADHQLLVHERDGLVDEVARLRARLAAASAPRHQLELTCDRCHCHITVASSLAVDAAVFGSMLTSAAFEGGWRLGSETVASLGMAGLVPASSSRDLCPACLKIAH